MTKVQKPSVTSPDIRYHACGGTFSMKMREKMKLIFAIFLRDMKQMHRHGLPVLLFLSVLLLFSGFLLFTMINSSLRDLGIMPTWTQRFASSEEGDGGSDGGGGEGLLASLTLLHAVYGYPVLVTMILVPLAFSTGYNHEIKKGTIRTIICYPVGVFEITIAKLMYAAVTGLIFSAPVSLLPVMVLGKPVGDIIIIFITAYMLTLTMVVVAAFTANAITFATKKMYIRPTFLPYLFIVFSFFTTKTVLLGLASFMSFASQLFRAAGTLTPLSPYHQGRLLLSFALGGPDFPNWIVFLIPFALLAVGIWLSLRVWPDIYERE